MKNKGLKIFLIVLAAVILLGAGGGAWYYFSQKNVEPVYVFPFDYVGMTEYWGDSQESYGPVSTDKIQTVYISDTQTVTEILVKEGDAVKKGDLLMRFDTTLSDLALERKRLDVEKLKLQLEDAKKRLREINSMKPMVIPQVQEETDKDQGTKLKGDYQISKTKKYDGSAKSKPLICWIKDGRNIEDALLEELRVKAEEFQNYNAEKEPAKKPSSASAVTNPGDTSSTPETSAPTETPTTQTPTTEPPATQAPGGGDGPSADDGGSSDATEPEKIRVNQYYVVFKTTKGNMSMGQRLSWTGVIVTKKSGDFTFRFFDAAAISDHQLAEMGQEEQKQPEIDFGSGYTAAQIAQMRSEQEKTIRDLEFNIKMADANYKIALTEAGDGNIYANIDGKVVSCLTEEEARDTMQPILKVSGGGGFYIEGSVSELEKEKMQIGQEVTVNDWNTGMTYTGTIQSVGDFPAPSSGWNGMGNPNASFYPFTVFVGEDADLQEGRYVSVLYSAATGEHGVYLQNPFLRTEQGNSYVYVLGADGTLEKRFVKTGKALWGSYTEILSGLSQEDMVAFPYGKNVKPGAPAAEGEMSDLYG